MDILTQIFLNETAQYFLSEWRNETMIALFCVFIFSILLKRQKEKIEYYEYKMYKFTENIKMVNDKLTILHEKLKDEEIKKYIREVVKEISEGL